MQLRAVNVRKISVAVIEKQCEISSRQDNRIDSISSDEGVSERSQLRVLFLRGLAASS